jgi:hypothetical protein
VIEQSHGAPTIVNDASASSESPVLVIVTVCVPETIAESSIWGVHDDSVMASGAPANAEVDAVTTASAISSANTSLPLMARTLCTSELIGKAQTTVWRRD